MPHYTSKEDAWTVNPRPSGSVGALPTCGTKQTPCLFSVPYIINNMRIETNKEKGNAGLALAIAYYGANGYVVSLPLNDTQDYDLIVDNGRLQKVQAKFSSQKSKQGHQIVPLRSLGGTKGTVYKRLNKTKVDYIFCANENGEFWEIPTKIVTQTNILTLNAGYDKYKVAL